MEKQDYIITNEELKGNYGVDLNDFVIDSSHIPPFINSIYEELITRIFNLNHDLKTEQDILDFLGQDEFKIKSFKKAQKVAIINTLIVGADENPFNNEVDAVLAGDLRIIKLNGYQKSIWRK